jgi:hypothetical protein
MILLTQLCPARARTASLSLSRARPFVLVAAGLAVAGLAGCGSAAPTAGSTDPRASASGEPAAVVAACTPSAIRITLDAKAAGSAAGSSYVPLEFTNGTSLSCRLPDYPAVAFASGLGGPLIGAPAATQGTAVSGLVLKPHRVAHAWLQVTNVADYPATRCQPVEARGLRVAFAGFTTADFLAHRFRACAKAVQGAILDVFPVQAGRARRGTAP